MVRFPCFLVEERVLAKITTKNQLTLPKAVASQFSGVEYFDVSTDGTSITLHPLRRSRVEKIWDQLEALGIVEQDVSDAIEWARKQP